MTAILPDAVNGGVTVRDANGVATNPPNVSNAYIPPSTFITTCQLTALPNDCTARITPAQINALVSELLCLAATLSATGTWNCASTCNLSAMFQAWVAVHMLADGTTIGGSGTAASRYAILPQGVVAAICADNAAADALAACVRSADANNGVVIGTDGGLFAATGPTGAVAAAPATTDNAAIPTDHYGTNAEYLGTPTRWVSFALPGVAGTITVPSYS